MKVFKSKRSEDSYILEVDGKHYGFCHPIHEQDNFSYEYIAELVPALLSMSENLFKEYVAEQVFPKKESKNMNDMREMYDTLSAGQKQYLANKLWKADGVVAQAFKEHAETLQPPLPKLAIGDKVKLEYNGREVTPTYILAHGEVTKDIMEVVLINLSKGHRWCDPIDMPRGKIDTKTLLKAAELTGVRVVA